MSNETPLLQLENISREFPSAENGEPLRVLRGLSLEIDHGESIAIVGPSGCGKSTLLNIIGTLDQPTTGKVTLDGQDLNTLDGNALAALRNREIGFIFHRIGISIHTYLCAMQHLQNPQSFFSIC